MPRIIIAFVSQKGGVGKSTLAVSIAFELLARGQRVLLVDADPQKTALAAVEMAKAKRLPAPMAVAMGRAMFEPDQLPALAEGADVVVIDTPGKLGDVSRAALLCADLALIPVGQSAADVWTVKETVDLVEAARLVRPALQAAFVLTRIKPRTAIGKAARASLQEFGRVLRSATTNRITWEECLGAGKGVAQYAPKDVAALELNAIVDELLPDQARAHG